MMTIEGKSAAVPGEVLELTESELLEMKRVILELWRRGLMFRERGIENRQEGKQLENMNKLCDDMFKEAESINDEAEKKVDSQADSSTLSKNSIAAIKFYVNMLVDEFKRYAKEVISTEFPEVDDNSSGGKEHSSDFFTRAANKLEELIPEPRPQSSETGEELSARIGQIDEIVKRSGEEIQKLEEEKQTLEVRTRRLSVRSQHLLRNNSRLKHEKNELSGTVHSLEEEIKQVRQLTWWQGSPFLFMLLLGSLLVNFYLLFRYLMRKLKGRKNI